MNKKPETRHLAIQLTATKNGKIITQGLSSQARRFGSIVSAQLAGGRLLNAWHADRVVVTDTRDGTWYERKLGQEWSTQREAIDGEKVQG